MPAKNHPLLPPGWTAPLLSANAMAYYQGKTDVLISNNFRAVGSAHALLIIKPALPLSADPLAQKVLALSRLRGVGAASRGTATLGAAAVLPYRAESFGVFVPDDDPKEPERAKDCPEYVKAEECRAAGCEWTKNTKECAHWGLKNSMGQPKPPPETLTPTTSMEFSPTPVPTPVPTLVPTPVPTAKPTAKPSPPTTITTTLPPTPSPTEATTTTKTFETTTTTVVEEVKTISATTTTETATTTTTTKATTTTTTTTTTITSGPICSAGWRAAKCGSTGKSLIPGNVPLYNVVTEYLNGSTAYGSISNWDVSQVTDMGAAFYDTGFNEDISCWDTSRVTTFFSQPGLLDEKYAGMFEDATKFNQSIDCWNVGSATNMMNMFYGTTSFNGDLSKWDVGSVTSMFVMFRGATSFNGDVSKLDTAKIGRAHV